MTGVATPVATQVNGIAGPAFSETETDSTQKSCAAVVQTGQLVFGTLNAAFALVGAKSAPTKATIDVTIVNFLI